MTDLYKLRDEMMALGLADRENLRALLDREDQRAAILPSREEQELWDVVTRLTPSGSRHHRSYSEFVRDKRHGVNRVEFNEAVRLIYDLAAQARPVRRPTQDRVALVELMVECLVKDMRQRRIEVNQRTIIEQLPRLRTAIEWCYPGYIEAGMLHRLIRIAELA
jgi:hypothetical protein